MNLTLDQVRAFVAVAEERHFGRAAERLAMTQPPLSRQIQKLERAVGATLFDRDNRSVALTSAGEAFLPEAYRLLSLVRSSADLARRVGHGQAGVLRLGFTAVSAIGILGPLLRGLSERLPDVHVSLHEAVTQAQVQAITRGELHLGLARPPFETDAIDSRLLVREPLRAVVSTNHPLAQLRRPLRPDDFDGEAVIGYHPVRSRYFHELCVRFLLNAHPRVEQEVHQVLTAILLAAAERGLTFAPDSARALGVAGVVLKELDLPDGESEPVELHAIWGLSATSPVLRRALTVLDDLRRASLVP